MFKKIDLKKRLKEYKKEIIKKIKFVISPVYQSFDGYILEKKILRKINVCQPKIPVKIEMMNNKNHKNLKIFGPNFSKKKNKNQLKKGQISFLALDGNKVIGMAWFTSGKIFIPQVSGRVFGKKKQVDFGKKTGYIFKVRVLPEYRGFGIGPRLYCEICNYAKRKKLSKIIVSMGIDNINSLKSFKKVGFQKKGRAKYRRILFWSKYNYQDIKNIKRYKNDQLGEN
jgi:ribosomal protein S18 acetylase RimI-like enzyme